MHKTIPEKPTVIVFALVILILIVIITISLSTLFIPIQPSNSPQINPQITPQAEHSTINAIDTEGYSMDEEEWNFVAIINSHRESLGLTKLKPSVRLTKAAEWMSNDMATRSILSHVDSLGRNAQARVASFGYYAPGGENVARVGQTGQQAFNAWLASTMGHKEEMETPSRRAIGIARVAGSQNTWFWTADFGNQVDETIPDPTPTEAESPTSTPTPTPTNSPTPSPTPTSTPTPTTIHASSPSPSSAQNQTKLYITYTLPGIGRNTGENDSPKNPERQTIIALFSNSSNPTQVIAAYATYNPQSGFYRLELDIPDSMPTATYTAELDVSNSLVKKIRDVRITQGQATTIPQQQLITGDIDSDKALTIKDYNLALACYKNLPLCTEEIKSSYDANDNGVTVRDIDDFAIMQRGFVSIQ